MKGSKKAMAETKQPSIASPPCPRYSHKRILPLTQWSSDVVIHRIMKINVYLTYHFIHAVVAFKEIHI